MTTWLAGLAGVVGLIAALVFSAVQTELSDTPVGVTQIAASADDEGAGESTDEGHGPPPWANNDHDKAEDKGKNAAWKALSPVARADRMAKLVKDHQQGMRAFAACQEAGGDACDKPLPPGLAKKL